MAKAEKPLDKPEEDAPQQSPPPKKGRPPKGTDRMPLVARFFDRMYAIPSDDWLTKGGRAVLKVYRREPISDREQIGQGKMIQLYGDGPVNEEQIKKNHGSGKYLLYLNYQQPGQKRDTNLDSLSIEIWDPQDPPKMYEAEWIDHPTNKRWEWAKPFLMKPPAPPAPPAPPPIPSSMGDVVGAFQVFNEIQKTATANAPPAPAAATADPMTVAMGFAEKLLTMRADNPMVTMMSEQLSAMRTELAAQRARSDALLDKLAEKNKESDTKTDAPTLIKTFFDGFKQLREQAADVLPQSGGRGRMGPWQEFFQPVLPSVMEMLKPVAIAVTQAAMQPNPPTNGPQRIQQTPGAAAQPQARDFGAFLDDITPRMLHFLRDFDDPAATFAEWFHDGYADAQRAIDTMISLGGVPALMAWYRTSKHWPSLAPIEAEFEKFLSDVIAWKPEAEPEEPPADATAEPVIDLDAGPVEAN